VDERGRRAGLRGVNRPVYRSFLVFGRSGDLGGGSHV